MIYPFVNSLLSLQPTFIFVPALVEDNSVKYLSLKFWHTLMVCSSFAYACLTKEEKESWAVLSKNPPKRLVICPMSSGTTSAWTPKNRWSRTPEPIPGETTSNSLSPIV
ncbi:hypothetical protein TNIN_388731 [Trichonephila inaurata madagascariensis]|uniref:Uncharacterized protein n=1 Tax=Trichonephila inaurata madagascariensis TaxID=2747483 RepID=A0A8X6MAF9_9ARAC|nr:hypothetical protein TNIN_388731 [Trichonephila inaurata madagascariensis]